MCAAVRAFATMMASATKHVCICCGESCSGGGWDAQHQQGLKAHGYMHGDRYSAGAATHATAHPPGRNHLSRKVPRACMQPSHRRGAARHGHALVSCTPMKQLPLTHGLPCSCALRPTLPSIDHGRLAVCVHTCSPMPSCLDLTSSCSAQVCCIHEQALQMHAHMRTAPTHTCACPIVAASWGHPPRTGRPPTCPWWVAPQRAGCSQ